MIAIEKYQSNAEANQALNHSSMYLGGGTLVMRALNYGQHSFSRIVMSADPGLKRFERQGDRILLGAGLTMLDVLNAPELSFLHAPARAVGGPAVRSMATIGGNLFAEHPYGDFATALLALGGAVQFEGGESVDLESFFSNRGTRNGLVVSVTITAPGSGEFRWLKISRVKPKGISVMSIAVLLSQSMGVVSEARVAFGAMGPTPLRAHGVEQALQNQRLDDAGIGNAVAQLGKDLLPPDDPIASSWYRTEVAPVHLSRILISEGER